MTVLAIAPRYDRPGVNPKTGKAWKDATGAFLPEARAFVKLHGGEVATFDNRASEASRFRETLEILASSGPIETLAFFCHGFKSGIQCGARVHNLWALARAIPSVQSIALYACDAARDSDADRADDTARGPGGEGGFASLLARKARAQWVDAHATAAHTTKNPHLRRFGPSGIGRWLVEPGSDLWGEWCARLQNDRDFRLTFPRLSEAEIRESLHASGSRGER